MKAVYERPNVHLEIFGVNDAVAACLANQGFNFECMSGQKKDYATVLNNSLELLPNNGASTCGVQAGIAYMPNSGFEWDAETENDDDALALSGSTAYIENSSGQTSVTHGSSANTSDTINASYSNGLVTATPKDGYNFLGWLYITGYSSGGHDSSGSSWTYDTEGWELNSNGNLFFDAFSSAGKTIHAMIAAIWSTGVSAS